eukprot:GFYU01000913.1.p1 GENE.GFYU01000913.1~~GFYU01000913.1.p1  ORF type:complete len:618 (-),score=109.84 GFYU01000913.1:270-2123(-)
MTDRHVYTGRGSSPSGRFVPHVIVATATTTTTCVSTPEKDAFGYEGGQHATTEGRHIRSSSFEDQLSIVPATPAGDVTAHLSGVAGQELDLECGGEWNLPSTPQQISNSQLVNMKQRLSIDDDDDDILSINENTELLSSNRSDCESEYLSSDGEANNSLLFQLMRAGSTYDSDIDIQISSEATTPVSSIYSPQSKHLRRTKRLSATQVPPYIEDVDPEMASLSVVFAPSCVFAVLLNFPLQPVERGLTHDNMWFALFFTIVFTLSFAVPAAWFKRFDLPYLSAQYYYPLVFTVVLTLSLLFMSADLFPHPGVIVGRLLLLLFAPTLLHMISGRNHRLKLTSDGKSLRDNSYTVAQIQKLFIYQIFLYCSLIALVVVFGLVGDGGQVAIVGGIHGLSWLYTSVVIPRIGVSVPIQYFFVEATKEFYQAMCFPQISNPVVYAVIIALELTEHMDILGFWGLLQRCAQGETREDDNTRVAAADEHSPTVAHYQLLYARVLAQCGACIAYVTTSASMRYGSNSEFYPFSYLCGKVYYITILASVCLMVFSIVAFALVQNQMYKLYGESVIRIGGEYMKKYHMVATATFYMVCFGTCIFLLEHSGMVHVFYGGVDRVFASCS